MLVHHDGTSEPHSLLRLHMEECIPQKKTILAVIRSQELLSFDPTSHLYDNVGMLQNPLG